MDEIEEILTSPKNKLAIVIPAYKAKYLPVTLGSIAAQTDQRFCVYIGDDNSPEAIEDIVSCYKGKFDFIYKHFDENLGGHDLVAQWERCIAMTQGEEWIWLFSDDDYMDEGCVAAFYSHIEYVENDVDLLRFDVRILNNDKFAEQSSFPTMIDSVYLYKNKMSGKCPCFAVEYIFSRKIHRQQDGFQNFDLAWNSDVATWIKFGINGIFTIKGPLVTWRNSGENITVKSTDMVNYRKWDATISFLIWAKDYFHKEGKKLGIFTDIIYIKALHGESKNLPHKICMNKANQYMGNGMRKYILITIINVYELLAALSNSKVLFPNLQACLW